MLSYLLSYLKTDKKTRFWACQVFFACQENFFSKKNVVRCGFLYTIGGMKNSKVTMTNEAKRNEDNDLDIADYAVTLDEARGVIRRLTRLVREQQDRLNTQAVWIEELKANKEIS